MEMIQSIQISELEKENKNGLKYWGYGTNFTRLFYVNNPKNIVVVKNPIVDILNEFYFRQKDRLEKIATPSFFSSRGIKDNSTDLSFS